MRIKCTNPATKALKPPWMDRTIRFDESRVSRYEVNQADREQLIETYPAVEAAESEDDLEDEAASILEEMEAGDDDG